MQNDPCAAEFAPLCRLGWWGLTFPRIIRAAESLACAPMVGDHLGIEHTGA